MKSSSQRAIELIMIVGTVVAVAAAFGPVWLVRLGVVVALAAAGLSCAYAWRELATQRRTHAAQIISATRAHATALHAERVHNGSVVEVLRQRADRAVAAADQLQALVEQLRGELATSRGDRARLLSDLRKAEQQAGELRENVRARERDLIALRSELAAAQTPPGNSSGEETAEVHVMPRRSLPGDGPVRHAAGREALARDTLARDTLARDAVGDAQAGDVVDLQTLETAVVFPNYEVDRRLA